MREYLKGYDLGEESVAIKYKSKAAEFYRNRVNHFITHNPYSLNAWQREYPSMSQKNQVMIRVGSWCKSHRPGLPQK